MGCQEKENILLGRWNQERYSVEVAFKVLNRLEQAEDISKGVNNRGYVKGPGKSGAHRCTLMNSQSCLDGRAPVGQQ